MSRWEYSVFGLHLWADQPIPGLQAAPSARSADVQLWSRCGVPEAVRRGAERLGYVSPYRDEFDRPAITIWKALAGPWLRFCFPDGVELVIDRHGCQVWVTGLERLPRDEQRFYWLGPVLTFVLRLRGLVCLHASCVAIAGWAVALLGPEGAGKSTTAAALAVRGYPVLSDDVVALVERNGSLWVQPAYPLLCLRPGGADALAVTARPPPRLTPLNDLPYLDLDLTQPDYPFQSQALPLAAVYLLDERCPDAAAPYLEVLQGTDGLLALVANTWASPVPDPVLREQEFALLARLAAAGAVRRVRPHTDPAQLGRLCERIIQDQQQRSATS